MRDNLERVDTSLTNVQYLATHSTQWLHDGTAFPVLTSRVSRYNIVARQLQASFKSAKCAAKLSVICTMSVLLSVLLVPFTKHSHLILHVPTSKDSQLKGVSE